MKVMMLSTEKAIRCDYRAIYFTIIHFTIYFLFSEGDLKWH